jgi:hypothetical protein
MPGREQQFDENGDPIPPGQGGGGFDQDGNPVEEPELDEYGNPIEGEPAPEGEEDEEEQPPVDLNRMTPGQLLALAASKTLKHTDEIDKLTNELLESWSSTMDPVLQPVIKLAQECQSAAEFKAGLKKLKLDTNPFVKALAMATLKARGLGDATDKL